MHLFLTLPTSLASPRKRENWGSANPKGEVLRNDLLGLALGKGSVSQEGLVIGLVKLCGRRQVISKVVRETQELLQRGGEGGKSPGHCGGECPGYLTKLPSSHNWSVLISIPP